MRSAPTPLFAAALLCATALLFGAPEGAYALDVVGNINVDTRWTPADSPIVLTGDVTVAPQATLTIEPGVAVRANASDLLEGGEHAGRVELIVRGQLIAQGTADSRIGFTCVGGGRTCWHGIQLMPGSHSSALAYVTIRHADMAVWVRAEDGLALSDCTFADGSHGVVWTSPSDARLERMVLHANAGAHLVVQAPRGEATPVVEVEDSRLLGPANYGIRSDDPSHLRVRRNVFDGNRWGVHVGHGATLSMTNNLVINNTDAGVRLTQVGEAPIEVINNTFDRNTSRFDNPHRAGIGIHAEGVSHPQTFIVRNNLVTSQGVGVRVEGDVAPSLDHNNIWDNGTNTVGVQPGAGALSINPLYVALPAVGARQGAGGGPERRWPPHNVDQSWNYDFAGATHVRAHFSYLSMDNNDDWVRLYDRDNNHLGSFTSSRQPFWTEEYRADYIRVRLTTDHRNSSAGFTINGFEVRYPGEANYRLQQASPVIDQGNALDAPDGDFEGVERPYDGDVNGEAAVDMGCYEWHENLPPLAVAGPDHLALPNTELTFEAAGSNDPDGEIVLYQWDFGDGQSAEGFRVTHRYAQVGEYTVRLTVTDNEDVTGTDTAVVTIAANLPPVAEAGPDRFAEPGEAVQFDGGASADPDGVIVAYSWDFGDGSPPGDGRAVSHTWARGGVYTATLTVTDNRGATGTDTTAVVIGAPANNQRPIADAGGPYAARVGEPVALDGSGSSDPDGEIVAYAWILGDGEITEGERAEHVYAEAGTFLVRLTVTDDGGEIGSDSTLVTVSAPDNASPTADAGPELRFADVGEELEFDGSGSSDPDGRIERYGWDFGDGSTAQGAEVTHAFDAARSYLVRLTVVDDGGASASDVVMVAVGAADNAQPVADAGDDRTITLGEAVTLDGGGSTDPDGEIVSWSWTLGDGTSLEGERVEHTYASSGAFLARLTVTDDGGATAEDFVLISVRKRELPVEGEGEGGEGEGGEGEVDPPDEGDNEPPVAEAGDDIAANAGDGVVVNASGSSDPDGQIIAYQWDFGDGGSAAGLSAKHTYDAGGAYTITLTVIDDGGARAQDTAAATINGLPIADAGPARVVQVGEDVVFDAGASHDPDGEIASHRWTLGDGTGADGPTVTHAYTTPGSYTATVVVTDDAGAEGRASASVTVLPADSGGGDGAVSEVPAAQSESGCATAAGSGAGNDQGPGAAWLIGLFGLALLRRR